MNGLSAQDRTHLEKLACRPGSVFSTCYRFSRPSVRPALLATQAFLSETGDIPARVSDPGIAKIKIAWWKNELSENLADSQHPIPRALAGVGFLKRMDQEILDRYFDGLLELSSGQAIESTEDLLRIAKEIGGSEVLMLAGAGGELVDEGALEAVGMGVNLYRFLNDLGRVHCNETWWLPMDLRARFGISSAEPGQEKALNEVVKLLASSVKPEVENAITQIKPPTGDAALNDGVHFIRVLSRIVVRRLNKLSRWPDSQDKNTSGPGEVFAAWWQAVRRQ